MNIDSSKCIQVIENIHKEFTTYEPSGNIGLHAGTSGIALFFAYYNRIIHRKKEVSLKVMDILKYNINCINLGIRQYTICDGISGFGWLCEHLWQLGMLDREDIEFLDDLDPFLHRMMITDIRHGNYDYLHGALGVSTYFLSRFDKKDVPLYLEELLIELERSGIACENGAIKWISVLKSETQEKGYNISLSHGMSSIVAFLIRLHNFNFETDRVDKLITQTINYILDQITYTKGSMHRRIFRAIFERKSIRKPESNPLWLFYLAALFQ